MHHDIHAEELPPFVDYEVVIAEEVRVGGDRLEAWFDVDPTSSHDADVVDDRWQIGDDERGVHEKKGVSVTFAPSNELHLRLRVELRAGLD